jgi:hypothetical protein
MLMTTSENLAGILVEETYSSPVPLKVQLDSEFLEATILLLVFPGL